MQNSENQQSMQKLHCLDKYESAEDNVIHYGRAFISNAHSLNTDQYASLLLIFIQSISEDFFNLIIQWGSQQEFIIIDNIDNFSKYVPPMEEVPQDCLFSCQILSLFSLVKTITLRTNLTKILMNRVFAAARSAGKIRPEMDFLFVTQNLVHAVNLLQSKKGLIELFLDFVESLSNNTVDGFTKQLALQILMIADFAEMSIVQTVYDFCNQPSLAFSIIVVKNEKSRFMAVYKELKEQLGLKFKYARLLKLPGIEKLNKSKYPNLSYCAWFDKKKRNSMYANVVAPRPNMNRKLLEEAILTTINWEVSHKISDENFGFGLTEEAQKLLDHIRKSFEDFNKLLTSEFNPLYAVKKSYY